MKKILILLIAVLVSTVGFAQIETKGTPASSHYQLMSTIAEHRMPSFDVKQVMAEDEKRRKRAKDPIPARFGHKMAVSLNLSNSGQWETLPNGDRVWRLVIRSKGAKSLNFLMDEFYMPKGAQLFIYNKDKSQIMGAFTSLNNKPYQQFSTAPIKGDQTIFEYIEPAAVSGQGKLGISHVVHAYRDLFKMMSSTLEKGFGDSGSCNIDVACPLGNNWQDEIKSVALILVNGNDWCSGAMVNNTLQDGTPYFLTADHCLTGNLTTWTFVFNYESPSCSGPNGNQMQSISGATLRANSASSDFALLELSAIPPPSYTVYYAGWDHSGTAPDSCTAIHHPSGDVKKISFNDDQLINGVSQGVNYWRITEWEQGTTEGGSSGSPIFDPNKRIVGQLYGGQASCTNVTWDEYGKFSTSWDLNTPNNQQLKHWLDPNNTGSTTIDGTYFTNADPFDLALTGITNPPTAYASCDTVITPSLTVRNLGDSAVYKFDVVYTIDGGVPMTYNWTGTPIQIYQDVTFTLPSITLPYGAHTLDAYVTMPNDSVDYDFTNDSLNIAFATAFGYNATVNLVADGNPSDNNFQILDDNNAVLFDRTSFTASTLNTEDFCLGAGCYKFVINDISGDGLGNGNFNVVIDGFVVGTVSGTFSSDTLYACMPYDLKANFKLPAKNPCVGETVTVKNTSQRAASYSWSMPGATPATSTSAVPTFSYAAAGNYNVMLTVTDVGGNSSDTTIAVTVVNGLQVTVNLLTDAFPEEITYAIYDDNMNLVQNYGPFSQVETLLSETQCLAEGCYKFVIDDSYGDGLSGWAWGPPGYFEVVSNGTQMGIINGNFGSSDTINVCLTSTAKANFEVKTEYCVGETVAPINTSVNDISWNWTIPNGTVATSNLEEPTFSYIIPGNFPITLMVTDANGNTDDTTITVTVTDGSMVTVDLLTDNYPDETSYEITDSTGTIVFASSSFSDAATNYLETICLSDGCYTFTIYDSAGDGICCGQFGDGSYTVTTTTGVQGTGGQFGASESVSFCINSTSTASVLNDYKVTVFPNPTNGLLYYNTTLVPNTIIVTDVVGRVVQQIQSPRENTISIEGMNDGVYFIRFHFDEGTATKKIIKH